MRVLYFSQDYTPHDRRFLARLADSRHQIWYLRLDGNGRRYEQRPLPAAVREARWPEGPPELPAVLDEVRPELVHAGPVPSCGVMAALAGVHPLVLMSWGSDLLVEAESGEEQRRKACYALERADLVVCDCTEVAEKARQLAGVGADRIVQFPWGVDLERFAPGPDHLGLRLRPGWEESSIVLATRRWERHYGFDTLLAAFRLAHESNPRLRLVLLGGGSLQPPAEDDGVLAVGHVSEECLPAYFRAADIYVSCAPSDGSSISLLEALASGLPAVVADRASNREWVEPASNGWLAPAGDASAFARAILRAADLDAAERGAMSGGNRRVAEERANWRCNSARLLAAYDRLETQYAR